jgi:hypothetical protein
MQSDSGFGFYVRDPRAVSRAFLPPGRCKTIVRMTKLTASKTLTAHVAAQQNRRDVSIFEG